MATPPLPAPEGTEDPRVALPIPEEPAPLPPPENSPAVSPRETSKADEPPINDGYDSKLQ